MSACGCSILTPIEKGFCSMRRPASFIMAKVSLALWPTARMRTSVSILSLRPPAEISAAFSTPSSITSDTSLVPKRISPPRLSIFLRRPTMTVRSTSVPMCGFARYIMSSPAPASRNSASTCLMRPSFIPVASLPSEKVPAPPSPKSMLASGSRTLSFLNLSTASILASISGPLSRTIGR